MTAYSSVSNAVEAMKLGAFHYVNKPFDVDEIVLLAEKALETTRLRRQVQALRGSQRREHSFDAIIGSSPAMQNVKSLLARVAASPASTVLLTGETGTGKDLAAKAIHYNSDRAAKPFVNITASALRGTLFLDEIGEMTPALQAKLLRFLEEKAFKRVGGLTDIRVDARVIAATNRNLEEEVPA